MAISGFTKRLRNWRNPFKPLLASPAPGTLTSVHINRVLDPDEMECWNPVVLFYSDWSQLPTFNRGKTWLGFAVTNHMNEICL